MAANVRCAGRTIPPVGLGSAEVGLPDAAYGPCGWKSKRFASGRRIGVPYFRWDQEDHKVRTAKPCPRCGGRVELIPEPPSASTRPRSALKSEAQPADEGSSRSTT